MIGRGEGSFIGAITSEAGCTKASRYVETPGKYEPCIPYKKGIRHGPNFKIYEDEL